MENTKVKRKQLGRPGLHLVHSAAVDSEPDLTARLRALRAKYVQIDGMTPIQDAATLAAAAAYFNDDARDVLEGVDIARALATNYPPEVKQAADNARENVITGRTYAAMCHAVETAVLAQHADALRLYNRWRAAGYPTLNWPTTARRSQS